MTGTPPIRRNYNPFDDAAIGGSSDSAYINVKSSPWSAIGDGVTDDTVALQAAFDYASINKVRVRIPAGTYAVTAEVQVDGAPIIIEGEPHNFTTGTGSRILAIGAMRSAVALLSPRHQLANVVVDAAGFANYGVYCADAGVSRLMNVWTLNAIFDGIHNSASGNNNHVMLDGCYSTANGRTYVTTALLAAFTNGRQQLVAGTVATTANNFDVVFTGAPDMTTLGLRKGDLIAIGGTTKLTASYYLIESVLSSTTVRLQVNVSNRPTATASGLAFAIGVGDGVSDRRNGNGGVWDIRNLVSFSNGGSGIHLDAAYGHTVEAGDVSYNNFAGVCFGIADNAGLVTNTTVTNLYCEGTAMCYFIGEGRIVIINPAGVIEGDVTQHFIYGRDAIAQATIISGNSVYDWRYGQEQNVLIQITNNGGTIQHRMIADIDTGGQTFLKNRISNATNAYTTTPNVNSGVAYAGGAGILSSSTAVFLLDTARAQSSETPFGVILESTNTATNYTITAGTVTTNVNGITQSWASFRLRDLNGNQVAWATALATPGAYIAVRLRGRLR